MADPSPLHLSLLRPPVLHILRAAGFTSTKPSVLDRLVDLTSRYLITLATRTAVHYNSYSHIAPPLTRRMSDSLLNGFQNAHEDGNEQKQGNDESNRNLEGSVTIPDIRMALNDVGALYPQLSELEELALGREDLRGIEAFVNWCTGSFNSEIRRVAGVATGSLTSSGLNGALATTNTAAPTASTATKNPQPDTALAAALEEEGRKEDFLTVLRKKNAKTGEESRYAGTALGKDIELRDIIIEGGGQDFESINAWERALIEKMKGSQSKHDPEKDPEGEDEKAGSESSGSPLTEISESEGTPLMQ